MNPNGKKSRKQTGLSRFELHKAGHTHKSSEKRRRMNWGKSGAPMHSTAGGENI